MAIHYKEINPLTTNNVSTGYEINDIWVNIVTYDSYKQTTSGVWGWVNRNSYNSTIGVTSNIVNETSNIQIKSVLELPEVPEADTWYAVQK